MKIYSNTKQKILLALLGGVALSMARSPKGYFYTLKKLRKEWNDIERQRLYRAVREFYIDRIVDYKESDDGTVKIVLTKEGERRALMFKFDEMKIKKPAKWDGWWRIVIFDIPQKKRKAREALRHKLEDLGFIILQKSVFVYPYECEDEIDFIVEVFQLRLNVRFIKAKSFTNEEQMRIKFGLV